tara:strand:+ start:396 stop:1085 length:690 start_codon:yes stop_codon:yes gene_type:complete
MNLSNFLKGLIICGTDTGVGKTIISGLIVQGLDGIYWKPIQSGLEDNGDTGRIIKLLNLSESRYLPETYKFKAPVSPHWASELENKPIDINKIKLPLVQGPLIIETAGGLMVPLNRNHLQIEKIQSWKLPVILVARTGLGTLNHTLLSIEALRQRDIPILGLILNGPAHPDNPRTLELFGKVPIICQIPRLKRITAKALQREWDKQEVYNTLLNLLNQKNIYEKNKRVS